MGGKTLLAFLVSRHSHPLLPKTGVQVKISVSGFLHHQRIERMFNYLLFLESFLNYYGNISEHLIITPVLLFRFYTFQHLISTFNLAQ